MRAILMTMLVAVGTAFFLGGCDMFKGLGAGGELARSGIIYYHYVNPFVTYERTVNINAKGDMSIVETRGNKPEDTTRVRTSLTEEQRAAIRQTFKDWTQLRPAYSLDVTQVIEISYSGHMVQTSGGESTPRYFFQGKATLDKIIQPIIEAHRPTRPATQPATIGQ